ncbi:tetratricopeptide repeat-containing sulfotransferase family protein [Aliikangiella coralliicola]|uniref:Tetratricopeptide repeat protein n=1 Tax=Aliikangiella coralliicola TaxID=2592383 RepID=A0A545UD64_9GAMM|nr:sulfotransferase [Aliikangiella coralliicola]TQV87407.1 hypothetical protein FLL46_13260 [Aliikangiella coralliicola]
MRQKKLREAQKVSYQFTQQQPENLIGWFMLADISLQLKQYQSALESALQAEKIDGKQPQIQILKSRCYLFSGDSQSALKNAIALMDTQPELLAKDWYQLGIILHQLNAYDQSHYCLKQAVLLNPQNAHFKYSLATSYRNRGEINKAYAKLNETLAINPTDWDAYLARSLLKTATAKNNHLPQLNQQAKTNSENIAAQIKLYFSIAKEQEDCAEYEASFTSLKKANELRLQVSRYQVEHDLEAMKHLQATFDISKAAKEAGDFTNNEAIFIVGLPRTGTTLLERIMTNHPEVYSAGELYNFSNCLTRLANSKFAGKINNKLELIKKSAELDFDQLGFDYIESTRPLTGHSKYFIDKLPLNFLNIGLIQRALPNAKIIHLTRAPMAACYAMYKTYFEQAYPFSYSLEQIGQYYIAYRKLMAHWHRQNKSQLIEVNYEQLVTEPAITAKQVFEFCGLTWKPDFLQINKNESSTATASAAQVRGNIYQTSINRWRHYEKQLEGLSETLTRAGIEPTIW